MVSIVLRSTVNGIPVFHDRIIAGFSDDAFYLFHASFIAGLKLFQGFLIHGIAAGIGLGSRAHGCCSQGNDMIPEGFVFPGGDGNFKILIPDPVGADQLQ